VDNADYPYTYNERRNATYLRHAEEAYQDRLEQLAEAAGAAPEETTRFHDALKIVSSSGSCYTCHIIGDHAPRGEPGKPISVRGLARDLSLVHRRLRPEYVRQWVANPKTKLPYTGMPDVIKYNANAPHLGGVAQELYHGTSIEQLDGLVDLLMNFDKYNQQQTSLAESIKKLNPPAPPPATETTKEPE
jgi:hypothetical protein